MDWRTARVDGNGPLLGDKLSPLPLYRTIFEDLPEVPPLPKSRRAQEALLVSDLLGLLRGCEGSYICTNARRPREFVEPTSIAGRMSGISFDLSHGIDPSLHSIVSSIVQVAKHHIQVAAYAQYLSSLELGKVNHALGEGLRNLSHRFLEHVAKIERDLYVQDDFTINTMTLLLLPFSVPLEHAAGLVDYLLLESGFLKSFDNADSTIKHAKGGKVLYVLAKRLHQFRGTSGAQNLYAGLLELASAPFLEMLSNWVCNGVINDPFKEFMVREKESTEPDVTRAHHRFELRAGHVPLKLSDPELARKVLLAGEYLNIVRECSGDLEKRLGDDDNDGFGVDSFASIEEPALALKVDHAFQRANKALLEVLLNDYSLVDRIESLKHYFFFDKNDFFELFLETAAKELHERSETASTTKLQYALDMALAQPGSRSKGEAYADEVKVGLASRNLTDELLSILRVSGGAYSTTPASGRPHKEVRSTIMPAYEALVLYFEIPFPLSLIVDRGSMKLYKFIFRNLLRIRLTDQSLSDAWAESVKASAWKQRSANPKVQEWKHTALGLRNKMQGVVRDILYYCTADVIERNSAAFLAKVGRIATVDELHKEHRTYLEQCLKECLLTDLDFLSTQRDILQVASHYGRFLKSVGPQLASIEASSDSSHASHSYSHSHTLNGHTGHSHTGHTLQSTNGSADSGLANLSNRLVEAERAFMEAVETFMAKLDEASTNSLSVPALVVRIQASMS